MNSKQESALALARGRVADAQFRLQEGMGWINAIFRAIERAPKENDDAVRLAEIGALLTERADGFLTDELADLKLELDTLCEVPA